MPSFGFNTANPSAPGRLGALIFEGDLPGRCKCQFASNYPYAVGPRLGGAYQINSKTVVRAGFGIVYSKTGNNAFTSQFISSNNLYQSPGQWAPAAYLQDGVPLTPIWPNFDPGQQPAFVSSLGSVGTGGVVDRNAGRPAGRFSGASVFRGKSRGISRWKLPTSGTAAHGGRRTRWLITTGSPRT